MDAIHSNKANSNKPAPSVSTGNGSSAPAVAHVVQPRSEAVVTNFSEVSNNNKKSVENLLNSRREIDSALAELKRLADNSGRSLGFSKDPAVSGPVITVTDDQTGKVVRQIPVEVVVRVAHSIEKMKGLLFDKSF